MKPFLTPSLLQESEDEELVKCESVENLTKQVKRELELSDRLDKSLLM